MAKSKAEQKRMTGRDMLLIGGLLAAGVAGLLAVRLWMNPGGSAVRITGCGGSFTGRYRDECPADFQPRSKNDRSRLSR